MTFGQKNDYLNEKMIRVVAKNCLENCITGHLN